MFSNIFILFKKYKNAKSKRKSTYKHLRFTRWSKQLIYIIRYLLIVKYP